MTSKASPTVASYHDRTWASQDVAAAVVTALRGVVPDRSEVHLSAEGGTVRIVDSSASPGLVDLSTFGGAGRLTTARAVTAVAALLSTVQDLVCEAMTEPWPPTAAGVLALPDAGVEGGWIVARFSGAEMAMPVLPVGRSAGRPVGLVSAGDGRLA